MELTRSKMEDAFARLIAKHRDMDPITLAEKLVDRYEFLIEDSEGGSGIRPATLVDDAEAERLEPRERTKPLRETPGIAKAPPLPKGGLILTPDDPEFAAAARASEQRPAARPRTAGRVSSVGHGEALSSGKTTEYWTIETLIAALQENTPAEFYFVPNGCEENVRVRAVRNIQPIIMTQGPSIVRLEYANPGVSQDRSSVDTAGQLDEVVLGLIASETFTMDMADLGLEAKMDSLEAQLKGLYAPRTASSEPMGRDPGPIEQMFNMNDPKRRTPMGENYEIHAEPGWRQSVDPQTTVMHGVVSTNKKYGNR